jgi:OmpA-OmpF porin, OOP family
MSVNLLDLAKTAMGGQIPGLLGQFLGESQSNATSGINAALPALIGALMNKGSTQGGAESLLSLINGPTVDAGIVSKLAGLFGNGGAQATSLIGVGSTLLSTILGDKVGGLAGSLGSMAGLKNSSATSLLGMAAPVLLGLLKSHVGQQNMNASGLMGLLKSQAPHLSNAVDPRLAGALGFPSVAGLLGTLGGASAALGHTATAAASTAGAAAVAGGSSLMKWLPWLVGGAALLWLLSSMRGCGADKAPAAPAVSTPPAPVASAPAPAAPAVSAPAAAPAAVKAPAAAKLYFEVNKFEPPADAAKVVDEMVVYARSNANTKLSISGYHDKTGDPAKNAELAKSRAMAVKNVLISAGVPEDRIMLQKPVETTGAADDKEARRVEVTVAQ